MMTYEQLVQTWKSQESKLPDSVAFNDAMALLSEARRDILCWQDHAKKLQAALDDYKAREATMDVMTLRAEVRALQVRTKSLETSLKLLNDTNI